MLHNVSPRKFIFLLGGPLLANTLSFMASFFMTIQATRMDMPPRNLAWIFALFSLAYAISSKLAGRWVNPARAGKVIVASQLLLAAVATIAFMKPSFQLFLVVSLLAGLLQGHYFAPFQIKMGKFKPFTTLAWTIGFYNISWSSGLALGMFTGGILRTLPPHWLALLAWSLAGIHTLLAITAFTDRSKGPAEYHPSEAFSSTSNMRLCGYISALVANFIMASVASTLWPALGNMNRLIDRQIAIGALCMTLALPLSQLFWPLLRRHMLRPHIMVGLLAMMGGGFLLMPLLAWPMTAIPLAMIGTGVAGLFFHSVYYANADTLTPGHSIGSNELAVGLGAVMGPLIMGNLAWDDPIAMRTYIIGSIIAALTAAFILIIWQRQSPVLPGQQSIVATQPKQADLDRRA